MSLSELAAALIGLRETTYKDHQRLTAALDELVAATAGAREAIDGVLDARLAQSAQAFRDVQRRLEELHEQRFEALLRDVIDVTDRLSVLVETADSTADPQELRERLASCAGPREVLQRALADAGVVPLQCVGQPYDPLLHEVVRREPGGDGPEVVVQELRGGWVRAGADHALVRARVILAAREES